MADTVSSGDDAARRRMIEGQVRPDRVQDPRILDAMGTIPREWFVPPAVAAVAYMDNPVPLGGGRVLLEPRVLARLLQTGAPRRGEHALVVAAGTGYGAAVLARLGLRVTALEADRTLRAIGEAACARLGAAVDWHEGAPDGPMPDGGPYDLVLVEGGIETVPAPIAAAVSTRGGRLLAVELAPDHPGRAVLGEHSGVGLRLRPVFDANAALLPGLARPVGFVF